MDCPGLYACVSAAHNTVLKMSIIWYFDCDAYDWSIRDRHHPLFDQGGPHAHHVVERTAAIML
jgi:hypothetical protein